MSGGGRHFSPQDSEPRNLSWEYTRSGLLWRSCGFIAISVDYRGKTSRVLAIAVPNLDGFLSNRMIATADVNW
jgi:hypothetical protein